VIWHLVQSEELGPLHSTHDELQLLQTLFPAYYPFGHVLTQSEFNMKYPVEHYEQSVTLEQTAQFTLH